MCGEKQEGIDKQSFLDSMGLLGLPSTKILGERMFDAMDTTGKGIILLKEYLDFMEILFHGSLEQKAEFQFKLIDRHKLKKVSYADFEDFMISLISMGANIYGMKLNLQEKKKEIKCLFNKIDANKNGIIELQEFKDYWSQNPQYTNFMTLLQKGIQIDQQDSSFDAVDKNFTEFTEEIQNLIDFLEQQIPQIKYQSSRNHSIQNQKSYRLNQQSQAQLTTDTSNKLNSDRLMQLQENNFSLTFCQQIRQSPTSFPTRVTGDVDNMEIESSSHINFTSRESQLDLEKIKFTIKKKEKKSIALQKTQSSEEKQVQQEDLIKNEEAQPQKKASQNESQLRDF